MTREASLVGAELCLKAREVGAKFRKPDEDWATILLVWRDGAVRAMIHVPVPPIEHGGHLRTALFQQVVPEMIRMSGGTAAAMLQSCWMVKSRTVEDARRTKAYADTGRSFEHLEGRIEIVAVTAADREGVVMWLAEIERVENGPPKLGEWDLVDWTLDGRIAAGLLRGVRG